MNADVGTALLSISVGRVSRMGEHTIYVKDHALCNTSRTVNKTEGSGHVVENSDRHVGSVKEQTRTLCGAIAILDTQNLINSQFTMAAFRSSMSSREDEDILRPRFRKA